MLIRRPIARILFIIRLLVLKRQPVAAAIKVSDVSSLRTVGRRKPKGQSIQE
jgi:hypothetical protein